MPETLAPDITECWLSIHEITAYCAISRECLRQHRQVRGVIKWNATLKRVRLDEFNRYLGIKHPHLHRLTPEGLDEWRIKQIQAKHSAS